MTPDLGIEYGATLVGDEFSNHCLIPAPFHKIREIISIACMTNVGRTFAFAQNQRN